MKKILSIMLAVATCLCIITGIQVSAADTKVFGDSLPVSIEMVSATDSPFSNVLSSTAKKGPIAVLTGEVWQQRQFNFHVSSRTTVRAQVQLVGNNGCQYTCVLAKDGSSNALDTCYLGANSQDTLTATVNSGNYHVYVYTMSVPSSAVGFIINVSG